MTKKQKRMAKAVAYLKEYMASYSSQSAYLDYSDETLIDDVLYGLGVALHGTACSYAPGFDKWRLMLSDHLSGLAAPTRAAGEGE